MPKALRRKPGKAALLTSVSATSEKKESVPPLPQYEKRPANGKPLNFRVSLEFHREFKTYAAAHGKTMLEVLMEGFSLVKRRGPGNEI